MSRVCQLTGKRANNGMAVSHSHVRTKKLQQVKKGEWRAIDGYVVMAAEICMVRLFVIS